MPKIELVPVLEIGAFYQNEQFCADSAAWKGLKPIRNETSYYKLSEINDTILIEIIKKHTEGLRKGQLLLNQINTLPGGYVVLIDDQEKFYPQCCCELSDINYWKKIAGGQPAYWQGHPTPEIKFTNNSVFLNLVSDLDESFYPEPPESIIELDKTALNDAVEKVSVFLNIFAQKLIRINLTENLGIDKIDDLLAWGNTDLV